MTYEEMISAIESLNENQGINIEALPHGHNLLTQLGKKEVDREHMYEEILRLYSDIREVVDNAEDVALEDYISDIVEKTNIYMDYFWPPQNNHFIHQSDFTSSIVPEMLCLIFWLAIERMGIDLEVSAQKDLTIECAFDVASGGRICLKNKRVDVAVVKPGCLIFNEESTDLPIPVIAIECKTNLDKNMLSGIEYSVSELKKTFPNCHYYVITECSDFDIKKANYASSAIDEIYVLRKQKRSVIRRNPTLRNPLDKFLVSEITEVLLSNIGAINTDVADLQNRMHSGKLIGGN